MSKIYFQEKIMFLIVFLFYFDVTLTKNVETILNNCKYTKEGSEFVGKLSRTRTGKICLFWESIATKDEAYYHHDLLFSDGSKKLAKNYCRNPTSNISGPWCYVAKDNNVVVESCSVQYCQYPRCQFTGRGMEYNGTYSKSASGMTCVTWTRTEFNTTRNNYHLCGTTLDETDCNACRNPDFAESGPWCLNEVGDVLKKDLCIIPFCDDSPVFVFGGEGAISTFHEIAPNTSEITLGVRLWYPGYKLDQRVAVLLSTTNIWSANADIQNWGSGVVISLGNTESFIVGSEIYDETESLGILRGTKWHNVTINWKESGENTLAVTVSFNENRKPALVADISTADALLSISEFRYFSLIGALAFWKFDNRHSCLVTTTSHGNKTMWRRIESDGGERNLNFAVRVSHVASVEFVDTPNGTTRLLVEIFLSGRVKIEAFEVGGIQKMSDNISSVACDYWAWCHFNISMIGNSVRVDRWLPSGPEPAGDVSNITDLSHASWVTAFSNSVGHWAFNCDLKDVGEIPKPQPPECATNQLDPLYNGTQDVTASGHHCLFWIDSRIPHIAESKFRRFGGRLHSENFCRNLEKDSSGSFCYTRRSETLIEKQSCTIRPCIMGACKLAGTGTDFVGDLSISKSLRKCVKFNVSIPFCHNIHGNIGGPWCYTTDPQADKDACNVKDCDRSDENTILLSKTTNSSRWHMLPGWRKNGLRIWLKNWVPERDASVQIILTDSNGRDNFMLVIGGGMEEKVKLFNGISGELLVQESISHLVMSATWTGLWLHTRPGVVELGREGSDLPFLAWEGDNTTLTRFVNLGTTNNAWVGVNWPDSDCLTERVWGSPTKYWPIKLRKEQSEPEDEFKIFDLYLQGFGTFFINFFTFPEEFPYWSLVIKDFAHVSLVRVARNESMETLISTEMFDSHSVKDDWRHMTVRFHEEQFTLIFNDEKILEHTFINEALLIYWFKVAVTSGLYTWASSCQPLDLNVQRNGGWGAWSEWRCSAACGGGEGARHRTCDTPLPSITGDDCVGPAVYNGVCNDYPCGDISYELLKEIRSRLTISEDAYEVASGESLQLGCHSDLIVLITELAHHATFHWSLNGFVPNDSRIVEDATNKLTIFNISVAETGVWSCTVMWEPTHHVKSAIMRMVSVSVTAERPTVEVRQGQPLYLDCNAFMLAQVYGDLSVKWLHDGTVWKDYGLAYAPEKSVEHIAEVTNNMSGHWKCFVQQEQLNLKWTTAWIYLRVLAPRNFWTGLIEDKATAPIFGGYTEAGAKLLFFAILFFVICLPLLLVLVFNYL